MKNISISIHQHSETVLTDRSWQFGIGNDRAYQMLRKDVCQHVKLAHDELGFKYLRFHGIFNDDMIVAQRLCDCKGFDVLPAGKAIIEESFREVANVYDNILEIGMKPFVEISFMPKAYAEDEKAGMVNGANVSMPKDLKQWGQFIRRFIHFLIDRYGKEEVESWYFEVWNEPDLNGFFSGNRQDYFHLYETTARAIKEVDSLIKVGGPSSSGCKWIDEFTHYCKEHCVPYDFVSTHHYPGDAFANQVNEVNISVLVEQSNKDAADHIPTSEAMSHLFYHPQIYKKWSKGILYQMDKEVASKVTDKELIISEYNSMAVFQAPVHDEKYSAAFVIKTIMDLNREYKGYMFWCCSDVFGELFRFGRPFVGIFGIVSSDGIKKPNFHAFKILSMLYAHQQIARQVDEDVEYRVFVQDNKMQILLYAQDFDPLKNEEYAIDLLLDFKASGIGKYCIDDHHCNPKAQWVEMGSPDLLKPQQVKMIQEKTELKEEKQNFTAEGEKTFIHLSMKSNDVILLNIIE